MRAGCLAQPGPAGLECLYRLAVATVTKLEFQVGQCAYLWQVATGELYLTGKHHSARHRHRADKTLNRMNPGRQRLKRIPERKAPLAVHDFPLLEPRPAKHRSAGVAQVDDEHAMSREHHMFQMDFALQTIVYKHIFQLLSADATKHAGRASAQTPPQP